MKKIFFALAALFLAFTACTSEDEAIQVNEKKAVKIVVNMDKPDFVDDTRAARDGWEGDEEVVVVLGNYFGAFVHLYYEGYSREWQASYYKYDGEEFGAIYDYNVSEFIGNLKTELGDNGNLKAIYLSSGEVYPENGVSTPATRASIPEQDVTLLDDVPETLRIVSNAVGEGEGECIMTCEDGSFEISGNEEDGYVLALNITMVPQVAQYTIRNLNVVDGWNIAIHGPVNFYAGACFTEERIVLTPIERALYGYPHQNGNDISIFAAPWQSNADIPNFMLEELPDDFVMPVNMYQTLLYEFTVNDEGSNVFGREFPFTQVAIGGAVIMDGPYTEDEDGNKTEGAQEWI